MNVGSIVGNHKSNCRQILDFWVDQCPRYGSLNFDQKALTDTGQSVISQVLWHLHRWYIYIYQIKGIGKGFLGKQPRKQWNTYEGFKINKYTFKTWPFTNGIFFHFL